MDGRAVGANSVFVAQVLDFGFVACQQAAIEHAEWTVQSAPGGRREPVQIAFVGLVGKPANPTKDDRDVSISEPDRRGALRVIDRCGRCRRVGIAMFVFDGIRV